MEPTIGTGTQHVVAMFGASYITGENIVIGGGAGLRP